MLNTTPVLKPTIVVTEDPLEDQRGYSIRGRELFLMEPEPRQTDSEGLDGVVLKDWYYVVSSAEYYRVVPEAALHGRFFDKTGVVLIPTFAAKKSFRPVYLQKA